MRSWKLLFLDIVKSLGIDAQFICILFRIFEGMRFQSYKTDHPISTYKQKGKKIYISHIVNYAD